MASRHRSNSTSSYRTYGSVAYAPAYDGSAIRAPGRESTHQPRPKARPRTREQALTCTLVREAGEVSPFAVIGFAAVGVFAALLIFSYAQFVMANDAVVTLRNDLKTLQAENVTLSARYEQVFDMERIQAAVGDTMVRPTEEQIVYLDLSEPDSVVLYGEEETASGIQGALQGFKNIVHELTEYFR